MHEPKPNRLVVLLHLFSPHIAALSALGTLLVGPLRSLGHIAKVGASRWVYHDHFHCYNYSSIVVFGELLCLPLH